MPTVPPNPAASPHGLAAPLPGRQAPPVVRGADDIPVPPGALSESPVPADAFQSFNNARAALFVHCPAGLNNAMRIAHAMRSIG